LFSWSYGGRVRAGVSSRNAEEIGVPEEGFLGSLNGAILRNDKARCTAARPVGQHHLLRVKQRIGNRLTARLYVAAEAATP
jgi:hypothetical protein